MNYRFQVKGVLSVISQVFISLLRLLLPIGRTLEKYRLEYFFRQIRSPRLQIEMIQQKDLLWTMTLYHVYRKTACCADWDFLLQYLKRPLRNIDAPECWKSGIQFSECIPGYSTRSYISSLYDVTEGTGQIYRCGHEKILKCLHCCKTTASPLSEAVWQKNSLNSRPLLPRSCQHIVGPGRKICFCL